ncbi:MAG: hypothetical protein A2513_00520 [Sulfurimonas sp. RIFOXYD12_FULL_33_39]|uniref:EAL domain-containing protein n=1 Tax=unclassified Sulfurimonas TaxID=2623549 RepID=UPI0008BE185D|nr:MULTISPECIES: EAL domain-containing protein [unclassified Sulfurimonas]OHE06851.1 MAG: hypothetical protein A3G74_04915 [Sulfurimonas sp. RIFCSPLOWO2_12_FULL_34_6]OHE10811.1 MAG: hypothetical protein A2513_00520 [Sulfurimonas sp. RIFOXYD12_FULL_33_39]OHE13419.1 MAG: hypothetical protein A2530_07660 [Sulfurimonas sp. RIFOXYD2_FULL_34_21]DAB28763.1 MAG TPA: hypothetical protein CFH78_00755 [Sulfurimonas sp. UBA10385]
MLLKIFLILIFIQGLVYSQEDTLQKVKLQLQWKYQFQFAGFIMAKELGYYKDVGLDVEMIEYKDIDPINELENDKVDYALINSVIAYKDKKLHDVTLLATYFQRSPLVIAVQPKIKSILDLKGKKFMISESDRTNSSLSILLNYFNINKENTSFIEQTYHVNDFIENKADAITAFSSNELFELNAKKVPYNIIDPVEYGFSTSANNLFTQHDRAKNSPKQIENFLSATKKGWEYAFEHIDETVQIIHKKYQPNKSIEHFKYEAKVTKELMLLDLYDIGDVNKEFVLKTYKQLIKNGELDKNQSSDKLIFDEKSINDSEKSIIELTQEEKEWIKNNKPITFTGSPNKLPYEAFNKNGNYVGIVFKYLKFIENISGLKFKTIPTSSWSESLQSAMNEKAKVVSSDMADATLRKKFNPINTYIKNPIVIVMDMKNNYVEDLNSIANKKIAVIKNYGYTSEIFNMYPQIKFIEVENIQEGLQGVSEGKYDVMLSSMVLANYTIADMALSNLKIVGKTPISMELALFVSKDEPILFNIINKSISSIKDKDKNIILDKWVKQQKYVEKSDYMLAIYIALFMLLIIFFILFWSLKMKQEIKKRIIIQDELQKSEQRYKSLFKSNLAVWLIIDPVTQQIVDCNESAELFYGYSHEQITKMYLYEINTLTPTEIQAQINNAQTLKKNSFYFKHRLSSGEIRDIEVFAGPLEIDGKTYMYSVIFDISARIKAEKELQKQHDFLQTVINSVNSGIMVIYKDFSVPLMNNTAREMIDEKIIQNPLSPKCYEISHHQQLPCNGNSHPCPLQNVLQTKERTKVIHKHSTFFGEEIIVELTAVPLIDENGEIYGIIESAHNITELKEIQNRLKHQAEHDSLTNLPNRVLFLDRLNQSMKNVKRVSGNIAVLFIDLDHFKEVNDSLGHTVGDKLLESVAKKLQNMIRQSDTVARLGGDEFAIILEHFSNLDVIISIVHNIMHSLKEPMIIDNQQLYVSLSIGISIYPNDGVDADTLIKNADAAMYKAKHGGRNNYQFYTSDMTEKAFERIVLETQLRQSIEKNQIHVYYQPQIDAKKETIIGMEALVRWNHPDMGMVSPAKFIPLAEDCGYIIELDEWVMREAISQFKKWYDKGLNPGVLSLNLSALRLEHDGFIEHTKDIIKSSNIDTSWLSYEITESKIMKNPEKSIKKLNELNELGIKLAIDDFGTGYSSLSYLKKLPIDKLKIDQSFIMDIPDDADDVEITKTIISMAKNLNLNVIAEGVETTLQRDFLLENGCSEIQGYLYYKPSPAKEIEEILKGKL